ncbi:IS66 family insertion sequence element accessory protein TnpB [Bradyrhizobium sp. 160]|uniref:IS66 family insertion sequence element accessory protein TnpB n=1 Tax=Bradyrhizobium sp. 160 TaxID=2782634 RepID=UPI001FF7D7F2|nr:IS66 family insertion sequence element accessory protein TnpB [Bradyrhizobium sp. 160]MCK1625470.1 IS66 family insertion sequence element accessory protein TnpB [Bradyrhizobium sp. 160]
MWIATGHTDMRRRMGSLALLVQDAFTRDPHGRDLDVFRGKSGKLIKILGHDELGMSFCAKRLERGPFLELFETNLQQSYTYKQLADALNAGGAQGRRGAPFTERSLYTCIARARARLADRGTAEIRVRAVQTGHSVATAKTSRWDQDLPNSPELSEFKQRISDAKSHAATGEFLFGRARRK